jgi:hypothetical protein
LQIASIRNHYFLPDTFDRIRSQSLRVGLAEYYDFNPHLNLPETQAEFGKILLAHDVIHVIYGLDTGIYDELKLLPLSWWTSECTFGTYLKMKDSPAVDVMYADMIRDKGVLWLYGSVLRVLPTLIPALSSICCSLSTN